LRCLPRWLLQVSKWLASDDYLVLDGPLRSMPAAADLPWSMQGGYSAAAAYGGCACSYGDARGCSDGQRGRNTASPCFAPGGGAYRFRSSQQQQQWQQFGGGYGRSRSMDPEGGQPEGQQQQQQQQRWQQGRHWQDFRDRAGSMDWDDDEGGCGVGEGEEGPWQDDDDEVDDGADGEGQHGGWCDGGSAALLEERRLEDMESLLGRILLAR
jgi:hypothetical protein